MKTTLYHSFCVLCWLALSQGWAFADLWVAPYMPDANTVLLDHLDGSSSAGILAFAENGAACDTTKPPAAPNVSFAPDLAGLGQALTMRPPVGQPPGSATYLRYPGGQLLSQPNGTLEFWVYLTDFGTGLTLVNQGPDVNACAGHTVILAVRENGQLWASAWIAFDLDSGSVLVPLAVWTHVALSWGSAGAKLYINGALVGTDNDTGMPASGFGGSVLVYNGAHTSGSSNRIDELRISNVQRTSFSTGIPIAPILTSIAVSPATATNSVDETTQFTATARFSDGSSQTLPLRSSWEQIFPGGTRPSPRADGSGVYDQANNRMIIFGGSRFGCTFDPNLNDTWVLTNANGTGPAGWLPLPATGSLPPGRAGHTAVYNPTSNRMIVFGGDPNCATTKFNDARVLVNANGLGGTATWVQLSPAGPVPPARGGHSAIYDAASNRMIIFGGFTGSQNRNDVWVLANADGLGGAPQWSQLATVGPLPPTRDLHSAVYDPESNRMIIFGGRMTCCSTPFLNDVWVLTAANGLGGTSQWIQLLPPTPGPSVRMGHQAEFDVVSKRMIIFGGSTPGGSVNATWILTKANGLDGTPQWLPLASIGPLPAPRGGAVTEPVMTYDQTFNRLTMFGGFSATGMTNDLWVLSNANAAGDLNWHSSSPSVASINSNGLALAASQGMTTIAASSDGVSGTATLSVTNIPPGIILAPQSQTVSFGKDVTLTVQAAGTGPLSYQWQFEGLGIEDATGASLVLTNVDLARAGRYSVVISNRFGTVTSSATLSLLSIQVYAGLTLAGEVGRTYGIEYLGSLEGTNQWTFVTNIVLLSNPYLFIDYESPTETRRFYRAVLLP